MAKNTNKKRIVRTREAILSRLVREIGHDHPLYRYLDDESRRRFAIHRRDAHGDTPWFLEEYIPKGIFDRRSLSLVKQSLFEQLQAQASPNTLIPAFQAINDDPDRFELMYSGFGFGPASFLYPTKADCVDVIVQHLREDRWYVSYDPARVSSRMSWKEDVHSLRMALAHWARVLEKFEQAATSPGIFRYFHGPEAACWPPESQRAFLAFLNHPTEDDWQTWSFEFISYQTTVGLAWVDFCMRMGRSPRGVPDKASLIRATRFAVLRDYMDSKAIYRRIEQELQQKLSNRPSPV